MAENNITINIRDGALSILKPEENEEKDKKLLIKASILAYENKIPLVFYRINKEIIIIFKSFDYCKLEKIAEKIRNEKLN